MKHANDMGANAVIGFRYDANEIAEGVNEVLAYGTAVKVEKINSTLWFLHCSWHRYQVLFLILKCFGETADTFLLSKVV